MYQNYNIYSFLTITIFYLKIFNFIINITFINHFNILYFIFSYFIGIFLVNFQFSNSYITIKHLIVFILIDYFNIIFLM